MRSIRLVFAGTIAMICGIAAFYLVPAPLPELTREEFLDEVRAERVRSVVIEDQQVITGVSTTRGPFRTGFNKTRDAGIPAELRRLGVEVHFEKSRPGLI